jgi:hypothetical protein
MKKVGRRFRSPFFFGFPGLHSLLRLETRPSPAGHSANRRANQQPRLRRAPAV